MSTTIITVDENYKHVLAATISMAVLCFLTPIFYLTRLRTKFFNKQFMEKNFGEVHAQEVGGPLPQFGLPDQGFGRFSDKLSYGDWYKLNRAQRSHQNQVEQLSLTLILFLVGGLYDAKVVAILAWITFFFRLVYIIGYNSKWGSLGRTPGAVVGQTILLVMMFYAYKQVSVM